MVRSVVEGGLSQADAARQFNTTPKTVAKWVKRFRAEGVDGLRDRSSQASFIAKPNPASHVRQPSRRCAGSATPASRSPPRSRCRRPPSAASCAAWA